MSGKWDSIVFHPITLKIPLCSRGKLKILFLAAFETGLVCNESEEFVYTYTSWLTCWLTVFHGKFEFRGLLLQTLCLLFLRDLNSCPLSTV